jgi:hypothetical protein
VTEDAPELPGGSVFAGSGQIVSLRNSEMTSSHGYLQDAMYYLGNQAAFVSSLEWPTDASRSASRSRPVPGRGRFQLRGVSLKTTPLWVAFLTKTAWILDSSGGSP